MKLIYIANARMPTEKAHGIQIARMCEAFANNDVEVELIIPKRLNSLKEGIFNYYGIKNNFKIKKIPCLDLVQFGRIGFWIQSFSFSIISFFYIIKKRADIIYSRDELPLYFLSFFKKNIFLETHMPRWNFLLRRILSKSKKIITITQGLKNFYIKNGVSEDSILVAPDGVDLNSFEVNIDKNKLREGLEMPINKNIIMYSGHLYGWKGAQVLADTSTFLDNGSLIVFVGGTDKDLKLFRNDNKDKKNILILGRVPHSEIPYYLKSADVLVLPNSKKSEVSEKYTSPMKLFEYMASGVPIVASDLPSIREVLSDDNAVLVNPNNSKALHDGISSLLRDKNLCDKLAKQSVIDSRNYSWSSREKRILKFI